MRTRLCATCDHFHDPKTYGPEGPQHAPQKGECRRYAPSPETFTIGWPIRMSDEWCGEWKERR